jgi:hypothetical protein
MKFVWIFVAWLVFWMGLTLYMSHGQAVDWDGIQQYFDQLRGEPWVLVERGFGQELGTKFRSEFGCHLAGHMSSRQYQTEALCFEDKKSAERVFPALRYSESVRD